jgi:hypothetical protein
MVRGFHWGARPSEWRHPSAFAYHLRYDAKTIQPYDTATGLY